MTLVLFLADLVYRQQKRSGQMTPFCINLYQNSVLTNLLSVHMICSYNLKIQTKWRVFLSIYRALVVRALWVDYICNSCVLQM